MGYHRAGFDVVGVDVAFQPNYPFEFVQADIAEWASIDPGFIRGLDISSFDAIHASPPCQAYTSMNNRHGSSSPPLIRQTRELLQASGLPYVIENVIGARSELRNPVLLTGEMFHLRVHRPRLFETNWLLLAPRAPRRQQNPVAVYGKQDGRRLWTRKDGTELRGALLPEASEAMGIDWMTWDEIREAIPPDYTELIGQQLMQHVLSATKGAA